VWGGSRAHVLRSARANGKQAKKDKNLNLKTKLFPSSEQKSDDFTAETRPLRFRDKSQNSNLTRFRLRVRIELFQQIRLFLTSFLQFIKTLERILSSSFDSQNSGKYKQAHYTKGIMCSSCIWYPSKGSVTTEKKGKEIAQFKPGPRLHVLVE